MKFVPSRAEPEIWMRDMGDHYEYIAVYIDDLAIASKDPEAILNVLKDKYDFKLKGSGPIAFHLGCTFYRDEDGVLCMSAKRYVERMVDSYVRMFGEKPKQIVTSPLESGDHPELNLTELLNKEGIKHYQSLIGSIQWAVSLGRLDVNTAVMTLSSFHAAP